MHRFKKRGGVISSDVEPDEVQLLQSLVGELVGLINSDQQEKKAEQQNTEDPFAAWAAELADDLAMASVSRR